MHTGTSQIRLGTNNYLKARRNPAETQTQAILVHPEIGEQQCSLLDRMLQRNRESRATANGIVSFLAVKLESVLHNDKNRLLLETTMDKNAELAAKDDTLAAARAQREALSTTATMPETPRVGVNKAPNVHSFFQDAFGDDDK